MSPWLTLFLTTLWMRGPVAGLLPVALEPILMLYGRLYPPFTVALVAGAASAIAEFVSFKLMRGVFSLQALDKARTTVQGSRIMRLFERSPFLAVAVAALTPVPDWITRTLASVSRYPALRYVVADTVGRLPKLWFTAALGGLVGISSTVLAWVAGASVVVAGALALARWSTVRLSRRHAHARAAVVPDAV